MYLSIMVEKLLMYGATLNQAVRGTTREAAVLVTHTRGICSGVSSVTYVISLCARPAPILFAEFQHP